MTTLKGRISNEIYIWRSSDNACPKCQSLDGKEYENIDDIPDRPHPNCKCYIEERPSEFCDCAEKIQNMIDEIDIGIYDIQSTQDETIMLIGYIEELAVDISEFSYNTEADKAKVDEIKNDALSQIQDVIYQIVNAIKAFSHNYNQLKQLKAYLGKYLDGAAEYYHTKANCEAAQLGEIGEATAVILGYIRENIDFPKEILFKRQSIKDAFEHSIYDLKINQEGRELGRQNPDKRPEDIIKQPAGMPREFW